MHWWWYSAVCFLAVRALGERLMIEAAGPRIHAKSAEEVALLRYNALSYI